MKKTAGLIGAFITAAAIATIALAQDEPTTSVQIAPAQPAASQCDSTTAPAVLKPGMKRPVQAGQAWGVVVLLDGTRPMPAQRTPALAQENIATILNRIAADNNINLVFDEDASIALIPDSGSWTKMPLVYTYACLKGPGDMDAELRKLGRAAYPHGILSARADNYLMQGLSSARNWPTVGVRRDMHPANP